MKVYEDNGSWLWLAFAPYSRLIVAFTIGPRKQYVANELVKLTADCLSENKPVFITDGLYFYKVALLNYYGVKIKYPRTGKRGRPKNSKVIPPNDLKYAQVVKREKEGSFRRLRKWSYLEKA